jgi:exonuclease III
LHANANGVAKKHRSLQNAVDLYQANIVTLNETMRRPQKLKGFGAWYSKERKDREGGGVAIAVDEELQPKTTEKTDHIDDTTLEVEWVAIEKTPRDLIFVGTYYGKQEKKERSTVESEFLELGTQVNRLKQKGEIILSGDFNAKLKVERNSTIVQQESENGGYLQKLIDDNNLVPINLKDKNGLWTREDRNNPEKQKSIIDYILLSQNLAENVTDIIVDEVGTYRIKGRSHSDHNSLLVTIKTDIRPATTIVKKWKLNNKEGWKSYNEQIVKEVSEKDPQTQSELQEIMVKTMKNTIGQVSVKIGKKKRRDSPEIKKLREEKRKKSKEYNQSIKQKGSDIMEKKAAYYTAQNNLHAAIDENNKSRIRKEV